MNDTTSIVFTKEQLEFLKQLVNNPQIQVPLHLARVAGQVHALVNDAK